MLNNVMLDLATWGTRPGCAIRSIGAALFDPTDHTHTVAEAFSINVSLKSCQQSGLHVDPSTMEWWSRQSKEAQGALEVEQRDLTTAISVFDQWFRYFKGKFVWSHGAAFDIPLYEAAACVCNMRVPWNHRDVRDTRTLFAIMNLDPKTVPFSGTPHIAMHDAIHQARCVQRAMCQLAARTLDPLQGVAVIV